MHLSFIEGEPTYFDITICNTLLLRQSSITLTTTNVGVVCIIREQDKDMKCYKLVAKVAGIFIPLTV